MLGSSRVQPAMLLGYEGFLVSSSSCQQGALLLGLQLPAAQMTQLLYHGCHLQTCHSVPDLAWCIICYCVNVRLDIFCCTVQLGTQHLSPVAFICVGGIGTQVETRK